MDFHTKDTIGTFDVSPVGKYLLLFLPVIVMPCFVLMVRIIRWVWSRFQPENEFGERPISSFHKKWRSGFSKFRFFMETSDFGKYWLVAQGIFAVGASILYVIETYLTSPASSPSVVGFTLFFAITFIIDYVVQFMIAEDRLRFTISFYGIVDLVSIPPMIIPLMASDTWVSDPLIQLLMITRTFRVFKVYRLMFFAADEIKRRVVSFVSTFVILVFLSAAFISALERYYASSPSTPSLENFHDSFYFTVISFTTVGYGDLVPTQTPTRLVMVVLLVFYMFLLPVQITGLARVLESASEYHTAVYRNDRKHPYFILSGNITYDSVVTFLREVFNNPHEDKTVHVVVLSLEPPGIDFKALLRNPLFRGRLFYIVGSPLSSTDLLRVKAHRARACILLRGFGNSALEKEDHKILMYAVAIKKLFPDLPLFAQVLSNMEKEAAVTLLCDRVYCTQQLNMSLMARACIAPGATTLIANLFRSYASNTGKSQQSVWLNEYATGCENSVNSFVFPKKYDGWLYSQVVIELFTNHSVTLIGMKALSPARQNYQTQKDHDFPIILNPNGDFEIKAGDVGFGIGNGDLTFAKEEAPSGRSRYAARKRNMSLVQSIISPDARPLMGDDMQQGDEPDKHPTSQVPRRARGSLSRMTPINSAPLDQKNITSRRIQLDEPAKLSDVTLEEVSFSGHIVVCGFKRSLHHFLAPLRLESVKIRPKVVIVTKETPTEEEWEELSYYPDVYFMKRDPTLFSVLNKAGISGCSRVVVLSNETGSRAEADADTMLIAKNLQEADDRVYEVIEMALESNVEFLTPPDHNWEARASEVRFILDDPSLSYRWKTIIIDKKRAEAAAEFIRRNELVKMRDVKETTGDINAEGVIHPLPTHHFEPFFASGHAHVSSLVDSLICQEIYRSFTLEIVTKMTCGDGVGQLFQIALPSSFVGKTYLELFRWLSYRNILPLGLYRSPAIDNELPYVFTNCPKNTELREKDFVFVLASTQPGENLK